MSLPPRVAAIIIEVAAEYRVAPADIVGARKLRKFVLPRWEAMRRVQKLSSKPSLSMMGRWFGGRDHTTVLHGLRKAEELHRAAEAAARTAREKAIAASPLGAALDRLGAVVTARETQRASEMVGA